MSFSTQRIVIIGRLLTEVSNWLEIKTIAEELLQIYRTVSALVLRYFKRQRIECFHNDSRWQTEGSIERIIWAWNRERWNWTVFKLYGDVSGKKLREFNWKKVDRKLFNVRFDYYFTDMISDAWISFENLNISKIFKHNFLPSIYQY